MVSAVEIKGAGPQGKEGEEAANECTSSLPREIPGKLALP